MNIKSLLLGSAAALLAVSGARAADAVEVVAEPEAVEYVRICDTYGAGFYYIPGTETCLRVGGFVRYQVNVGNELRIDNGTARAAVPYQGEASDYGWQKTTTASIQLDARTATEYGTLRAKIDARGTSSAAFGIDSAFIELGGLHIGYSGNAYDFDFDGEQDTLGGPTVNRIAYTYVSDSGLSATVSIDDDGDVIVGSGAYDAIALNWYNDDTRSGADFVPNVSANIRYASGPISAGLYGAYDNDTDNGVIKGMFAYSFSEADKLSLGAYWSSGVNYASGGGLSPSIFLDGGAASPYAYRSNLTVNGEWSVQGEYWHRFNEKLAASIGGLYTSNVGFVDDLNATGLAAIGLPSNDYKANFWRVGTTIDYTVTPGFNIKTSLNYNKFGGSAVRYIDDQVANDDKLGDGFFNGFIRFQRDF